MCSVTPRQAPETSKPLFSHPAQPNDINDANLKFWSTSVIRHTLCHRPLRFRLWPGTTGNRERASDLIKTPKGSHNWRNGGRCLVLFFWWEHLGPFLRSLHNLHTSNKWVFSPGRPCLLLAFKKFGTEIVWTRRLPPQFPACAQQVKGQKPRSWGHASLSGNGVTIPSIPQLWPFCTEKNYQLSFWTALSPEIKTCWVNLSHNSRILINLCYVKGIQRGGWPWPLRSCCEVMLPELPTTTESQGANHLTRPERSGQNGRLSWHNLLYQWDIIEIWWNIIITYHNQH